MKDLSITTAIGVARILTILGCGAAYLLGKVSLLDATAAATTLCGLLGGVGFFYAQDSKDPKPPSV